MHGGESTFPPDIFAVSLTVAEARRVEYDVTQTRLGTAALALAERIGMPAELPTPLKLPRLGPNDFNAFERYSRGVPTPEIKQELGMAERTLWLGMERLRDRTGVRNNQQLVRRLMEAGLLPPDPPHPDAPQPEWLSLDEYLLLGLRSRGWTTKNITGNLAIPSGTVSNTDVRTYKKLRIVDEEARGRGKTIEFGVRATRRAFSLHWLVPDTELIKAHLVRKRGLPQQDF